MVDKTAIMFVCYGNICRSPMAEFCLKSLLEKNGISDFVTVSSSAVSDEEIVGGIGNPVYPPAKAELTRRGVRFGERRAVRLKKEDYGKYDLFIGMDEGNVRGMLEIFGKDPQSKIVKLKDFTSGGDVADPWYTRRFDIAYDEIEAGCRALTEMLRQKYAKNPQKK